MRHSCKNKTKEGGCNRKGDGKAVVICTEEGEEEYRIDELKELNVDVLIEEDEECLSKEHLEEIDRIYEPKSIYIEFNGMWNLKVFLADENGIINVDDTVFGPWFVECIENTEKYYGKTVRLRGVVTSGNELGDRQFYVGRYVVVCCVEDSQFIGFTAQYDGEIPDAGEWVSIQAVIKKGEISENRRVIMLEVNDLEKTQPPEDKYLYF